MEFEAFVQLVSEMRAAQLAYFRTRQPDKLQRAKQLELRVDQVVRSLCKPAATPQKEMF